MKRVLACVVLALAVAGCSNVASHDGVVGGGVKEEGGRVTASFDKDWRFMKGEATGAEAAVFNDEAWEHVDVPHDWAIAGPIDRANKAGGAGAFLPAGVGWYRKSFTLPGAEAGKRVFIDFDGVMANSDVYINGFKLGHRPYGYMSFEYDMTGHLNFDGRPNVLAVKADTSQQPASRWYAGSGIYRHVRLVVADAVHVEHWGTFVTTPAVTADQATVKVATKVVNQGEKSRDVMLQISLVGPDGKVVNTGDTAPQSVGFGETADFSQEFTVKKPALWNLEGPNMYRAVVKVMNGAEVVDEEGTDFGIRDFKFEPATGFWLNGKNFKIKGVAIHDEGGAVGAAVPMAVWERRFKALKEIGVNGIRTAHNPPEPGFLDLCDRMGFVVMDETFDCWTVAKNPFDYHLFFKEWNLTDTRDTILRDRNHPSIFLWSVGNEIHDTPNAALAKSILGPLVAACHENDPTRPVTQALFRPNVSHDYDNGLADMLDVVGQNYREQEILAAYKQKPTRKIIGTENAHDRNQWVAMRDHPEYSGQFLWSGIDYLGESRMWPRYIAGSGLLDVTGTPKAMGYLRQSWWAQKPVVHIARTTRPEERTAMDPTAPPNEVARAFCNWTPGNLNPHEETVEVYSNAHDVELFLNGKSLGSQEIHADATHRTWKVPFEPGVIKAVARDGGKDVATEELKTAGKAARLVVTSDKGKVSSDWEDVDYVNVSVVDEQGVVVPGADALVKFAVTGPGVILGSESANPVDHDSFLLPARHAFEGKVYALVRASAEKGEMVVTATAEGLAGGGVKIGAGR